MPRYHFHIIDGRNVFDRDGMVLSDDKAARREAVYIAGAILEHEAARIDLAEDWHMVVTDGTGLVLFRLVVFLSEAPGAMRLVQR